MNVILSKFKEVLFSVVPIVLIVLVLHFTFVPLEPILLYRFLIGSVFVIVGLTIFLFGIDIGITPLGMLTGSSIAKTGKLSVVLIAGLILGFFISIAEPGLMVLANQVDMVTGGVIPSITILVVVSIGLAIMLDLGFLRVFYNFPLYILLAILYGIIFIISLFTSKEFLAIGFDASGATTGILAVPFILSLSLGISKLKKDSKALEKDSFGLVAIASTGAIMSVLLLDIFSPTKEFTAGLEVVETGSSEILAPFFNLIGTYLKEGFLAILPLLLILLALRATIVKIPRREMRKVLTGFVYSFIGLFCFLLGVNAGFMDVGTMLGSSLAIMDNHMLLIIVAFILGFVTILAEPAVYVLTTQIESVTSGYVKKQAVLAPLALGVGIAVSLSVIRIITPGIQLWHYLLPGYIISIALMFIVPKLFVGIAFDAGGVATGPVTATFILAFIQGAASAFEGADLMADGFGMISMVAMTPIITLQMLGLIFALNTKKRGKQD